jgi:hypothetical protein
LSALRSALLGDALTLLQERHRKMCCLPSHHGQRGGNQGFDLQAHQARRSFCGCRCNRSVRSRRFPLLHDLDGVALGRSLAERHKYWSMQISGTRHSSTVSMDLTVSPVSVCTASGSLAVAICTGGVSAGSFCEEPATDATWHEGDHSRSDAKVARREARLNRSMC